MVRISRVLSLLVLAALTSVASGQESVGTAFTYQGLLESGGSPFSGTANVDFKVYDALSGGSLLGTVSMPGLSITDGIVQVDLDFGSGVFTGDPRYLQIEVDGNILNPRQPILPTVYAMHADSVGSVPDGALSGTYSDAVSLSNASNTFAGDGAGITGLNAGNIASGNLGAGFLPTGGSWSLATALSVDSGTLAVDPVLNRVGIGVGIPQALLHVAGDMKVDGSIILGPTSRTYSISHIEFQSASHAYGYSKAPLFIQGTVVGQFVIFLAPVHLPNGANIDQFDAYVFDNAGGAGLNLTMILVRNALDGSSQDSLATLVTTGSSASQQTVTETTILNPTVDNDTYSYFILAQWQVPNPAALIAIYNARIKYTVSTPLP